MANQFQFSIPRAADGDLSFTLGPGDVLYLLGANGTGKSSLISRLFNAHPAAAKRISAHRQTWFQSNSLDMTPHTREALERDIRSRDAQHHARYRLDYANERAGLAIYDLVDSDTMLARKIAELVRAGNTSSAEREAKKPSPIQEINELMRLSNIPIEISLEDLQKIVARKNRGSSYSIAELSDGERNAFLIAADVLTAKAGTLLLIDEPERHLHRSIISPMLKLLVDKRDDCAFIISTHELMLPLDTPDASTLLVRACHYAGSDVQSWTVDLIEPGAQIDEDLKRDLLGSRRLMIFIEGAAHSLDSPLYSLLFPQVSVIPKEGCRDVEHAVRGLRGAGDVHWVSAWGIVDNDQRNAEDVARLKDAGVWALSHYSVESLYYHPKIIARVAKRQAGVTGGVAKTLVQTATTNAMAAAKNQRDHLIASAVLRSARNKVLEGLPTRKDIQVGTPLQVEVDVAKLRALEEKRFDALISAADWDGLLTRYPLRESSAFDRVVDGLKIKDRATYQGAVLKLLQDEPAAVRDLRNLLGDLYASISSQVGEKSDVRSRRRREHT
jgi:ABC-type cobalamin/Fe3+-siderophores transport system ATPase subunit